MGVLQTIDQDRRSALQGKAQQSQLAQSRNQQNRALKDQHEANQQQGLLSGAGMIAGGVATANPVFIGMGAITALTSIF